MIQNGIYFITAMRTWPHLGLVLDVPGGDAADHVVIQQYGFHGGPNQQWQLTNLPNGLLTIVNVHTGKALDVPYGHPIPGLHIQQFRFHGGPNQQWRFETFPAVRGELTRPEYHRIYNGQSGLAMDVPNGSLDWRVKIQQYTPHNGWNQAWLLEKKQ